MQGMPRDARLSNLQLLLAYLLLAVAVVCALPTEGWPGVLDVQWPDVDIQPIDGVPMVVAMEGQALDVPLALVDEISELVGPFDEPVDVALRHPDGRVETRTLRRGSFGVTSALESIGVPAPRATARTVLRLRLYVDVAWRGLVALTFLLLAPRHPTAVAWAVVSLCMVFLNLWGPVHRVWLEGTYNVAVLATAVAVLTYPDGRLTRMERAGVVAVAVVLVGRALTDADGMLVATGLMASLLVWATINAIRSVGLERQRYKWLGLALGFIVGVMALDAATIRWGSASLQLASFVLGPIGGTLAFVSLVIPIVRFRMWDLPLFVGQGVVLALIAVLLVISDFVIGTVASAVLGPTLGDDLLGSGVGYVIALLIALSVHPVLTRLVERLAFPQLEVARSALAEGRRALHLALTEDEALRAAVAGPSRAFDVEAVLGEGTHEAGAWVPHGSSEALVVPVGGATLLVPAPHGSRHLTSAERSLLDDWATEVELALERTRSAAGRQRPTP